MLFKKSLHVCAELLAVPSALQVRKVTLLKEARGGRRAVIMLNPRLQTRRKRCLPGPSRLEFLRQIIPGMRTGIEHCAVFKAP